MSFPLPPEFERAVLDRVASGRYASAEDVLRALVDALEEREEDESQPRTEAGGNLSGVTVDPFYKAYVDEQVRSGRFASWGEVLDAAIATLRRWDGADQDGDLETLRNEIASAFEDDEVIPGEEVEAMVLARLRGGTR